MRKLLALLFLPALFGFKTPLPVAVGTGSQPQLGLNKKGTIRIVFGRNDSIFCAASTSQGSEFSKPVLVGVVPEMHLGMGRGPQLASSAQYSVITAMDKKGDIHFFQLADGKTQVWKKMGFVNDVRGSAPEGLMNLAADDQDHFYAVWLDVRIGKKNNVFFSSLQPSARRWQTNKLVYRSPDGHVCECCRPSIAVQGSHVAVMFRNWLFGSRDLYAALSVNGGKDFNKAEKLGTGTWRLNACPMDGGGLAFNTDLTLSTTWQRQGSIYYCKKGEGEQLIGTGRDCSLAQNASHSIIAFSTAGVLKVRFVTDKREAIIGKGSYLKMINLPGNRVLCVWQEDNEIKAKTI